MSRIPPMTLTTRTFSFEGGLDIDTQDPAFGFRIVPDPEDAHVAYLYSHDQVLGAINAGFEREDGEHTWFISTPHGEVLLPGDDSDFDDAVAAVLIQNFVEPVDN